MSTIYSEDHSDKVEKEFTLSVLTEDKEKGKHGLGKREERFYETSSLTTNYA